MSRKGESSQEGCVLRAELSMLRFADVGLRGQSCAGQRRMRGVCVSGRPEGKGDEAKTQVDTPTNLGYRCETP